MKPQDFAKVVSDEMQRQGITQSVLASKARIHQSSVSEFINGKKHMRSDVLARVFSALSLEVVKK